MVSASKQRLLVVAQPALASVVERALQRAFTVDAVGSEIQASTFILREPGLSGCMIDADLPGNTGVALVRWIWQSDPGLPTLLIARPNGRESAADAAMLGVPLVRWPFDASQIAEILKNTELRALGFLKRILRRDFDARAIRAGLSPEQEVVSWMSVLGASAKQVAESKGVTVRTVESHRFEVLKKLDVKSTDELRWKLLARVLPDWRRGK